MHYIAYFYRPDISFLKRGLHVYGLSGDLFALRVYVLLYGT